MFPRPPKICALPEKIGVTTKKPLPKKICVPTRHTLTPVLRQKTHCRPSLLNPKTSPNASRLLATSPESHCYHSYASKPPKLWLENPLIEHRYNPSKTLHPAAPKHLNQSPKCLISNPKTALNRTSTKLLQPLNLRRLYNPSKLLQRCSNQTPKCQPKNPSIEPQNTSPKLLNPQPPPLQQALKTQKNATAQILLSRTPKHDSNPQARPQMPSIESSNSRFRPPSAKNGREHQSGSKQYKEKEKEGEYHNTQRKRNNTHTHRERERANQEK